MTTAGGFPVLHIPGGWAYPGWLLHPVFRQPHCCGSSPEPTGAHVPDAQRWVGAPPGLVSGQFFEVLMYFGKAEGSVVANKQMLVLLQLQKNTGILCCKLPLLEWCPVLLSWSKAEHESFKSGKFTVWKRPLVKVSLQTQCYGQLITAFPLALLGAGSDTNSEKPSQENCCEWTPASHLEHNLSAFLLHWFWPINCLFVLFLFGFVCSTCLFVTSLQEKPLRGAPLEALGGAGGNHPYHVFSLRPSTKVCSPNTKCENDVSITKAFSQRGWAVIWNKLIFSWEESKSLEVLFF